MEEEEEGEKEEEEEEKEKEEERERETLLYKSCLPGLPDLYTFPLLLNAELQFWVISDGREHLHLGYELGSGKGLNLKEWFLEGNEI